MRRVHLVFAVVLSFSSMLYSANSFVVPTTTLAAKTANNTSAAGSFTSQTNGNRGAGNISKVDVHSLLYSGATTKVYAHLMLWFGPPNHMNVGYSSTDPVQVHNQIADMISRGIDGVVIDWYGPNNSIDQATADRSDEPLVQRPGALLAQRPVQLPAGCTPTNVLGG